MHTKAQLEGMIGRFFFKSNLLIQDKMLRQKPTQFMENCGIGRHLNCLQNLEGSIILVCGLEKNLSLKD